MVGGGNPSGECVECGRGRLREIAGDCDLVGEDEDEVVGKPPNDLTI